MFRISVAYPNMFDEDQEVQEVLYFNLSKSDIMGLFKTTADPVTQLTTLAKTGDGRDVYEILKDLAVSAYGEKSADGRRFIKNKELREAFESSAALDAAMDKIMESPESAINFITQIVPKEARGAISKKIAEAEGGAK